MLLQTSRALLNVLGSRLFQATRCAREESDFVSVVIRLSGTQDPQRRKLYEWPFGSGAEDGAQSRLMANGSQKSS